jgi:hypothetical protein
MKKFQKYKCNKEIENVLKSLQQYHNIYFMKHHQYQTVLNQFSLSSGSNDDDFAPPHKANS